MPTNLTDWFEDASGGVSNASGPLIQSADVNIDGQALIIKRPDAAPNNLNFNGKYSLDLGYNMGASRTKAFLGFAVKYSKAPDVPIPLVQFISSSVSAPEEQASLWLSRTGQLFFSSVDFDITSEAVITPAAITGLISGDQVFNFDTWNYIEVSYNTGTAPTTVTVTLNNVAILDGVALSTANKSTIANIGIVNIINPHNLYFSDDSYDMYLDDYYIGDGFNGSITDITGPQHIILLEPSGTNAERVGYSGRGGHVSGGG